MADADMGYGSPPRDHGHERSPSDPESILGNTLTTRQIEAFGRKVTATAGHLIGTDTTSLGPDYHNALSEMHRQLRRPLLQRSVWSFTKSTPREFVRTALSVPEIQHRALTYISDDLLAQVPEDNNTYSLFQGFQASIPDEEEAKDGEEKVTRGRSKHGRQSSKTLKLLKEAGEPKTGQEKLDDMKRERDLLVRRIEVMAVRKSMCSSEIKEIDNKIANLSEMRKIVLERLEGLEQEEFEVEHALQGADLSIDELQEEVEESIETIAPPQTPPPVAQPSDEQTEDSPGMQASFMSESIYEKIPKRTPPRARRRKPGRRTSAPILHEHLNQGSQIREIPAHNDLVTALDFDYPFGTAVTAALDDTVRVWDLHTGRCMGLLEGHLSSVRCLQVEENIVATGSMDASIRLWDLSKADYHPPPDKGFVGAAQSDEQNEEASGEPQESFEDAPEEAGSLPTMNPASMADCPLFTLSAHVAEVTALHFSKSTLVSGSADKTLRQWDLEKGRCVQTLDVLWAAAQASATINARPGTSQWRPTGGRLPDADADFVGALQCFDAALACGTADGVVRLWDLRSGTVHRNLVGHTGPITALQFDDVHLVTGSFDRSIRIWDLRTGNIFDAYGYDNPVTGMMFDQRRIATAISENVVKVYDKTDGRHWDCGPGAATDPGANISSAVVERVRIKDGYMMEGRKDGTVGVWVC